MAGQRSGGGRSGSGGRSRSSSGRSSGGRSGSSRSSSERTRSGGGRSGGSSRRAAGDGRGGRTRARQGQAPDGRREDMGRHGPEGPEPRRPPRGRGRAQGSLRGLVSVLVVAVIVLGCYLVVSCAGGGATNDGDEATGTSQDTLTVTDSASEDADASSDDTSSDDDAEADGDASSDDDATPTATSFLERVTELQATYGEAAVVEADEDGVPVGHVSGLAVALLVDVQGDGESELLLAYLTDASSQWPYLTYAVELWGSTTGSDELELLCSGTLVYPYDSPCIHIVDLSGSQIVYWPSYDVETDADLGYYVTPADFGEVELHETCALVTFTTDTDYTITYSIDGTEVDQETYEAYATTYDIYGSSHDVEYVYLDGSEDTVALTQETIASLG